MGALDLLGGDARTFLEKVWASRVHVHRGDPHELSALLSLDDVDRLLTETGLRTPVVRLARNGEILPASAFTRAATLAGAPLTGLVDGRLVLDLFEDGASVVLQGLHRYWPPLRDLVRSLELALGHPCQANAYLTPPDSQGFALHSDSHDVFVFQTFGDKQWDVQEDTATRDAATREVLLEPGVSMYLPTGTPHAARTRGRTSLHVTIGVNRTTWRQALEPVLRDLLADESFDAPVPAAYLEDPTPFVAEMRRRLDALAGGVTEVDPAGAVAGQVERFLTRRGPLLSGGLVDRVAVPDLDDDTVLARRPLVPCRLLAGPQRLRVLLGDRELRAPLWVEPALRIVASRPTLRPGDLADVLDAQSRLVLTKRLVREGLLRVAA